jgi:hypothetical protein
MGLFSAIKEKFRKDGEFKYDKEQSESVSEKSMEWDNVPFKGLGDKEGSA